MRGKRIAREAKKLEDYFVLKSVKINYMVMM